MRAWRGVARAAAGAWRALQPLSPPALLSEACGLGGGLLRGFAGEARRGARGEEGAKVREWGSGAGASRPRPDAAAPARGGKPPLKPHKKRPDGGPPQEGRRRPPDGDDAQRAARKKAQAAQQPPPPPPPPRVATVPERVSVRELARALNVPIARVEAIMADLGDAAASEEECAAPHGNAFAWQPARSCGSDAPSRLAAP